MKLFAVYDRKTEMYLPPFCAETPGAAERDFANAVNSENHHFGMWPEDYTLAYIADYDQSNGHVEARIATTICTAIQVKKHGTQEQPDNSVTSFNDGAPILGSTIGADSANGVSEEQDA